MKLSYLRTILGDNRNPHSLATYFRRKRANVLREFMKSIEKPCRILDVGGTESFWINSGLLPMPEVSITLLNITVEPVTKPEIVSVAGSGCDLTRWSDKEFDLVFSNSVIEHVGSFENQVAMAKEVQRVGKHYFVQTPARSFPYEPHFHFPFFWCFPEKMRELIACKISLGWYPKQPSREAAQQFLSNFLLLNRNDFSKLFPNANIIEERFLGLTKSYIALSVEF